jgi:phage gp36-like protein
MAYISTSDLSARLGATVYARLTDRVAGTTANAAVAQQIVDEAEGEANAYLSRRYATPVDVAAHSELVDVLKARVLDLAEYLAWKGSPFVNDLPSRVRALCEETRGWLERLAAGALELPASGPLPPPVAASDAPRYAAPPRVFTAEELDGL